MGRKTGAEIRSAKKNMGSRKFLIFLRKDPEENREKMKNPEISMLRAFGTIRIIQQNYYESKSFLIEVFAILWYAKKRSVV